MPLRHELIPDSPTRWYLTGFLIPVDAPEDQRYDETSTDELDAGGEDEGATDDAGPPDPAATKSYFHLPWALASWLNRRREGSMLPSSGGTIFVRLPNKRVQKKPRYKRQSRVKVLQGSQDVAGGFAVIRISKPSSVDLGTIASDVTDLGVPNSNGLELAVTLKGISSLSRLPAGTKSASVFLVTSESRTRSTTIGRSPSRRSS